MSQLSCKPCAALILAAAALIGSRATPAPDPPSFAGSKAGEEKTVAGVKLE
jgi:hypothetical protein